MMKSVDPALILVAHQSLVTGLQSEKQLSITTLPSPNCFLICLLELFERAVESQPYCCRSGVTCRPDQLNGKSRECVFVEEVLENNYTALMSAKYKG
eukprot:g39148.t1